MEEGVGGGLPAHQREDHRSRMQCRCHFTHSLRVSLSTPYVPALWQKGFSPSSALASPWRFCFWD